MLKLEHIDMWMFTHNNVRAEIRKWQFESESCKQTWKNNWNYYIYLNLSWFESKELADSLWLEDENYYSVPFFCDFQFHGGITFYQRNYPRIVKIGCDYQHWCDEGQIYSEQSVAQDAIVSIEDFLSKYKYGIEFQIK